MNTTSRSQSRLLSLVILALPLGNQALADFQFDSAERLAIAEAHASGQRDGVPFSGMSSTALGSFQGNAFAWASGDYYTQADAWQRSSLSAAGIRIEQSARASAAGFPLPGWWQSSSFTRTETTFTITQLTPYWIIMNTPDFSDSPSGGLVRIASSSTDPIEYTGVGTWQGFLNPGTYFLSVSVFASSQGSLENVRTIYGGWLFAGIGVPAPATSPLLALTIFIVRRRRSAT